MLLLLLLLLTLPQRGGGSKTQNGRFLCKIALRLKKVCYKVFLCENCQRQSCKAFIGLSIRAIMIGRGRSLLRENLANTDPPADCRSIFAHSPSAVIPSEKSSTNTNRKSTTRFLMNLTWTSYVAPKPQKGGSKTQKAVFRVKSHCAWRKSATKWDDDGKWNCVVTYANSLTSVRRLAVAKRPCDCSHLIFTRSASAVTHSANSSINSNRKSTTHFLMSLRWTVYIAPKPHRVAQKRKMSKIWTIICDNSVTVRDRMSVNINHFEWPWTA